MLARAHFHKAGNYSARKNLTKAKTSYQPKWNEMKCALLVSGTRLIYAKQIFLPNHVNSLKKNWALGFWVSFRNPIVFKIWTACFFSCDFLFVGSCSPLFFLMALTLNGPALTFPNPSKSKMRNWMILEDWGTIKNHLHTVHVLHHLQGLLHNSHWLTFGGLGQLGSYIYKLISVDFGGLRQ